MRVEDIEGREVMPGFRGRFIHSERTTHVYWEIDPEFRLAWVPRKPPSYAWTLVTLVFGSPA